MSYRLSQINNLWQPFVIKERIDLEEVRKYDTTV